MLRLTKLIKCIAISSYVVLFLSACASAPGMRVGDLPPSGTIVSINGLKVKVDDVSIDHQPLVSPADVTEALPLFTQSSYPIYLLAPGDVLSVNLWANPELAPPPTSAAGLAAGYTIDQAGYIDFPLVGRIKAEGESLDEFSKKLQTKLSAYLRQPDVQVKVLSYVGRKFNVDGAVKVPGQYAMSDRPQTLYSALTSAGGVLEAGDVNNILFTRAGQQYHIGLLDLQNNGLSPDKMFLREGDSVHIFPLESRKIYVIGEAGLPSTLMFPQQGLSLANAIGESKGLNPLSADPAMVYVLRDDVKHNLVNVYHLSLSSIVNLAVANRFKMQPNDIVYVDASGLARWSRVLNLLLPSAQGLASLSTAGYYGKQQ